MIAQAFDYQSNGQIYYRDFVMKTKNTSYQLGSVDPTSNSDPLWREKQYRFMGRQDQVPTQQQLGWVHTSQLQRILQNQGHRLDQQQIRKIISENRLHITRQQKINYKDFLDHLHANSNQSLYTKLAQAWGAKNVSGTEVFRRYDYNGQGWLSPQLFYEAISYYGGLNQQQYRQLLQSLPRNREGKIMYSALIQRVTGLDTEYIQKVYNNLKRQVELKRTNLLQVFQMYDIYNKKLASKQEVKVALQSQGIQISQGDIDQIFADLDKQKTGSINFVSLISKIGSQIPDLPDRRNLSRGRSQERPETRGVYQEDRRRNFQMGERRHQEEAYRRTTGFDQHRAGFGGEEYGRDRGYQSHGFNMPGLQRDPSFGVNQYQTLGHERAERYDQFGYYERTQVLQPSQRYDRPAGHTHWALSYLQALQRHAQSQKRTITQIFLHFDKNNNNHLSFSEFQEMFRQTRIQIPRNDLQRLLRQLDTQNRGEISLTEFQKLFPRIVNNQQHLLQVISEIKHIIESRNLDIKSIFKLKDRQFRGLISPHDFISALREIYPRLSPQDCRLLVQNFDTHRTGEIKYQDFIWKLQQQNISVLNHKVRNFIQQRHISLSQVFQQYDTGDHYIHHHNIRRALQTLHLPISQQELSRLIHENSLGRMPDGRLSIQDLYQRLGVHQRLPQPRPSSDNIYTMLRQHWMRQRIDPVQIFKKYDFQYDNHLTKANFELALAEANCPLTHEEIEMVWGELDKLRDGRVDTQQFIRLVLRQQSPNQAVYEKIKKYADNMRMNLHTLLVQKDADKDGKLTRVELQSALHALKCVFS